MSSVLPAMYGGLVVMCVVAALFFLSYWRMSKDRFFIWFASAFGTFALNWALLMFDVTASEHAAPIYAVRLLGFLQILAAILLKNRSTTNDL